MTLTFRLATPDDADLVYDIIQDAWKEYLAYPIPSAALEETPEGIRDMLAHGKETTVLGFADGEDVLTFRLEVSDHLYFSRLGVRPAHQGKGYAKEALRWMEGWARDHGLDDIRCRVRATIARNVNLYTSQGFTKIDEAVYTKGPGLDLVVWTMAKRL